MCLAIIGKLISVEKPKEPGAPFATGMVEFDGIRRRINLGLLSRVKAGDYLMVHAGFAIQKVSAHKARETARLWKTISAKPADKGTGTEEERE